MALTDEDRALMPLTTEEAREFLRIGRSEMLRLFQTGTITAAKVGKKWLVSRAALLEFIAKGNNQNGAQMPDKGKARGGRPKGSLGKKDNASQATE